MLGAGALDQDRHRLVEVLDRLARATEPAQGLADGHVRLAVLRVVLADGAAPYRHRLAQELEPAAQLARCEVSGAQVVDGDGRGRAVVPVPVAALGQGGLLVADCRGVVAVDLLEGAEVVEHVGVVILGHTRADGGGAQVVLARLLVAALLMVGDADVGVKIADPDVVVAQGPAPDGERLAVVGAGLLVAALAHERAAEVVLGRGDASVVGPEHLAADGQCLAEERLGLGRVAGLEGDAAHRDVELRLEVRVGAIAGAPDRRLGQAGQGAPLGDTRQTIADDVDQPDLHLGGQGIVAGPLCRRQRLVQRLLRLAGACGLELGEPVLERGVSADRRMIQRAGARESLAGRLHRGADPAGHPLERRAIDSLFDGGGVGPALRIGRRRGGPQQRGGVGARRERIEVVHQIERAVDDLSVRLFAEQGGARAQLIEAQVEAGHAAVEQVGRLLAARRVQARAAIRGQPRPAVAVELLAGMRRAGRRMRPVGGGEPALHERSPLRSPGAGQAGRPAGAELGLVLAGGRDGEAEEADQRDHRGRLGDADKPGAAPERGQERFHRREARVRIDRHSAQERAQDAAGAAAAGRRGRGRSLRGDAGLAGGGQRKRPLAVQRLVQRDREGELIGARVDRPSGQLLGRHVHRRAGRTGARPGAGGAGHTEVDDADASGRVLDDNVVRLEVAVHQPGGVGRGEALAGLHEGGEHVAPRSRRVGAQPLVEVGAGDVLHGQVDLVAGGADLEHGDQVGMRQAGQCARLGQDALADQVAGVAGSVQPLGVLAGLGSLAGRVGLAAP